MLLNTNMWQRVRKGRDKQRYCGVHLKNGNKKFLLGSTRELQDNTRIPQDRPLKCFYLLIYKWPILRCSQYLRLYTVV